MTRSSGSGRAFLERGDHLWAGLLWIAACEIGLFAGVRAVGVHFTPLVWWGYIIAVDGAVRRLRGRSLLVDAPAEFRVVTLLSVPLWLIFEYYNLFIDNWHYVGLPVDPRERLLGYAVAFASILPALLETADLLGHWFGRGAPSPRRRRLDGVALTCMAVGAVLLLLPFVLGAPATTYLAAAVFIGFVPLLDPLVARAGLPSFLADAERGSLHRAAAFLLGGTICGLLWEFWNFWALAKWNYTVPILPQWRLFEMPLLGYLGFGPFAMEMYVLYLWVRGGEPYDVAR